MQNKPNIIIKNNIANNSQVNVHDLLFLDFLLLSIALRHIGHILFLNFQLFIQNR